MSNELILVIVVCGIIGFGIVSNLFLGKHVETPEQKTKKQEKDQSETQSRNSLNHNKSYGEQKGSWKNPIAESWCEILKVRPTASAAEIKGSYRQLIHQYHPDRFQMAAPEITQYAALQMKAINAAYADAKALGRV